MAKQKKRGFFSWLGFGEKEQETEQKIEEQQTVEEHSSAETPVETAAVVEAEEHTHSKEETEAFAEEIVEVTEQVQESEKPEPVAVEEASEALQVDAEREETIEEAPQAVIEHEELPLPEEVKDEEIAAEEWQAEAETVEIVEAVEEEAELEPELTDEELEAQALAAEAAEEAVIVVPEEEQAEDDVAQEQEKPTKEGFFARLKRSLLKTKENLGSGFISLFRGKKIDDDVFEELEEQLLIADVGVETTRKIITSLTEGASRKQLRDAEALYGLLKDEMGEILAKVDEPLNIEGKTPFVILMVGVNGVGKTTTIGKLARQFEQQGKSVMLAAGDTFRAAAIEQLKVWGERTGASVIAREQGSDAAGLAFDALTQAKAAGTDVLLIDTAGRLQNKAELMAELAKVVRVIRKVDAEAPHAVLLVLDATVGQNAVAQVEAFRDIAGVTGLVMTKLDGTARGGILVALAAKFGLPVHFIGVGEGVDDLEPFDATDFARAVAGLERAT